MPRTCVKRYLRSYFVNNMTEVTLIERAARIATEAHKKQVRKSDGSPYIVHPFMCAMLLQKHGFSDTVIAAALVHDVLEDTVVSEETLHEAVGDEVVAIVHTVSEDKALRWEERKQAYADSVAAGGEASLAVSCADKTHNLHSMLTGFTEQGPTFWDHFNRGRDDQLWFIDLMLNTYKTNLIHPLVDEYASLVSRFKSVV